MVPFRFIPPMQIYHIAIRNVNNTRPARQKETRFSVIYQFIRNRWPSADGRPRGRGGEHGHPRRCRREFPARRSGRSEPGIRSGFLMRSGIATGRGRLRENRHRAIAKAYRNRFRKPYTWGARRAGFRSAPACACGDAYQNLRRFGANIREKMNTE